MITEMFLIGLIAGFLYYEFIGISPGGVIAPAYFALHIFQPDKIAITLLMAFFVYGILHVLSQHLIIYGRRKLLIALLLGFFLKLIIDLYIQPVGIFNIDLQSIGYIIPGLVANEMQRQKVLPTILSLFIVMLITYLIFQLI